MDITLLGTANPCPQLERAGTSILVRAGGEAMLVDCGPMAATRLIEHSGELASIVRVFFTHHHFDHNGGFFPFVMWSWFLGRRAPLIVYGPAGTDALVDGFETAFRPTIDAWTKKSRPASAVLETEVHRTTGELRIEGDDWQVTALEVDHSLETFAYRFEEPSTGAVFVFSGDTTPLDALAEFATGADVLVHECNKMLPGEIDAAHKIPSERYTEPPYRTYYDARFGGAYTSRMATMHSAPAEAAGVAAAAGVGTLVLSHLNPYRDPVQIQDTAADVFDGDVCVGEDGLTFSIPS